MFCRQEPEPINQLHVPWTGYFCGGFLFCCFFLKCCVIKTVIVKKKHNANYLFLQTDLSEYFYTLKWPLIIKYLMQFKTNIFQANLLICKFHWKNVLLIYLMPLVHTVARVCHLWWDTKQNGTAMWDVWEWYMTTSLLHKLYLK